MVADAGETRWFVPKRGVDDMLERRDACSGD
jgi:hypothetical protein